MRTTVGVLGTVVALTVSGCGVTGFWADGGEAGSGEDSAVAKRVVPAYPPPLTYEMGNRAASYTTDFSDGGIEFAQRPVRFRLDFKVRPKGLRLTPLVVAQKGWRKTGVRPEPFQAGNAQGLVGEGRATDPLRAPLGPGVYRTYVVTRPGTQTSVLLRVYAPKGQSITDEHRETADRLMRSVRIDESRLSGRPRGPYVGPVVPFSYVRPPELTGGEKVTAPGWQEVEITYGRKEGFIRIDLSPSPTAKGARELFEFDREREDGADDESRDIKDLPAWADEGYRFRSRLWGRAVSSSYHFRSGRWTLNLTATGSELGITSRFLDSMVRSIRMKRLR